MRSIDYWNISDDVIRQGKLHSVLFKIAEDETLEGAIIHVDGKRLVHFGSCSYLGLELDPRLKQGAIDAVRHFGTQFSSSRAYISAPPYHELTSLFADMFGAVPVIAPTTSLAHSAAIPVMIDEHDALILDQYVHNSVQMAANHARLGGATVEVLRHARLDQLAERIEVLSRTHRKVWYALDGVFSMQGVLADVDTLVSFLDRYEKLYLYFDDAHGISWSGEHGRGTVLGRTKLHPRMVVVASLAKGFGCGGGVLLIGDAEQRRRTSDIGPSLMFSGPIQPPILGAAIASARIHLADEITQRQAALRERIKLVNQLLVERDIPLLASDQIVPIRFVGVGVPRTAFRLAAKLQEAGFFVNPAVFPAVPERRSGIRFTLTCNQCIEDIRRFADALSEAIGEVFKEEGITLENARWTLRGRSLWAGARKRTTSLTIEHQTSIEAVNRDTWNSLLGRNGSFNWEGVRSLETIFRGCEEPENQWNFHYYVVRDRNGHPQLATFFTEALWKDDMLAPEHVSRRIELQRLGSPYLMTSRGFSMGSLLTEGQHLYLDRETDWRRAMFLLLEEVDAERERCEVNSLMLRDIPKGDLELDRFLKDQGFVCFPMPDTMVIDLRFGSDEEWLESLTKSSRRHQRKNVLPWESAYTVEVLHKGGRIPSEEEFAQLHQLYRNVKSRGFKINTFELPRNLFPTLLSSDCWEILTLTLKPENGGELNGGPGPVALAASVVGVEQYAVMIAGLDYRYVRTHASYRQMLLAVMRRARHLKSKRLLLGLGSEGEKHCFGAVPLSHNLYVQTSDQYQSTLLHHMMAEPIAADKRNETAFVKQICLSQAQ